MRKKLVIFILLLITATATQAVFADIKVKSKQTMSGQTYENTTYIKGKRQRAENMNGMMVNITQCDLRRAIQMNPSTKTFVVNEFGEIETTGSQPVNAKTNQPVTRGGRVVTTINVKDTGERKQMFGYNARHLIITMDTQSSPESCSKSNTKMEMDGWYIDFEAGFDCDQSYSPSAYSTANGGCQDKYETKTIGTGKRGYALYEKMTMFDQNGKETMSFVTEVVELSKSTLDASLFEVPADYRQVSDSSELYAAAPASTTRGASPISVSTPSSGLSNSLANAAKGNEPADSPTVGAKKQGTVRIGIADVKTGAIGEGVTAADLAAAIESTMMQYLKVPNVEVVPIDAKLASAIDAEARQKECDFVLNITASHKKGGGGGFGKMFGSALGAAVGRTGIGHTGSTAGNIAGQIATQSIVSATSVSSQMKAKDEISLDVKFISLSGGAGLAKAFKVKSKSDGDDIISAVIEQAAEAIVATISK